MNAWVWGCVGPRVRGWGASECVSWGRAPRGGVRVGAGAEMPRRSKRRGTRRHRRPQTRIKAWQWHDVPGVCVGDCELVRRRGRGERHYSRGTRRPTIHVTFAISPCDRSCRRHYSLPPCAVRRIRVAGQAGDPKLNPPGTSPTPAGSEGYPAHLPPPGVLATCVRVVSWCVSMGLVARRVSNVCFTVIDCFRMSESTLRYTSLDPYPSKRLPRRWTPVACRASRRVFP